MKLKNLMSEAYSNPKVDQLVKQLVDIAATGELGPDVIADIDRQLTSARKKFFTSKRTPDSYKSAVEKSKLTRTMGKVHDDTIDAINKLPAFKNLGTMQQFALSINNHGNDALQKPYAEAYGKLFPQFAKKVGVTDPDVIKKYRKWFYADRVK
jgi:hypothetical protein